MIIQRVNVTLVLNKIHSLFISLFQKYVSLDSIRIGVIFILDCWFPFDYNLFSCRLKISLDWHFRIFLGITEYLQ